MKSILSIAVLVCVFAYVYATPVAEDKTLRCRTEGERSAVPHLKHLYFECIRGFKHLKACSKGTQFRTECNECLRGQCPEPEPEPQPEPETPADSAESDSSSSESDSTESGENPQPEPEEPTSKPEEPTPKPEEPTPKPEEPTPEPEEPVLEPEEPVLEPEEPVLEPEEPVEEPTDAPVPEEPVEEPEEQTDAPVEPTEEPIEEPEEPIEEPEEPIEEPEEPIEEPEEPTDAPAPETTKAPEPEPTDAPEPEPTDAPEPETTKAPEPSCPVVCNEGDHYLVNPLDCGSFYQCSNGKAILQPCPAGLVFNPNVRPGPVCDWPWAYDCKPRGCDAEPQPQPGTCPEVDCSLANDDNAGLFPDPSSCSNFYQCSNGTPYKMNCSAGLHFDPNVRPGPVCNYPEAAKCVETC